jgi:hypothetical protein
MSRKDPNKRRRREEEKRRQKHAADEAARKQARARKNIPNVLEQLNVLFQEKGARAISMAFERKMAPNEIAEALGVEVEKVEYLFDIASGCSDEILRIVARWPQAFDNPEVLKVALAAAKKGGLPGRGF